MQFVYIPGYTADQIAVWFPTTRLMACADTFYDLFPNMYTVRGEPPRDALAWSRTVRIVRSYKSEVLCPQHQHPIFGRQYIADVLERLADAMQYVHDQTLRQLAKGKTPDVIAASLTLPESLANEPKLIQVCIARRRHEWRLSYKQSALALQNTAAMMFCVERKTAYTSLVGCFNSLHMYFKVSIPITVNI